MCVAAPWHGSSEYVQCLLGLVSELSRESPLLKYVAAMNSFYHELFFKKRPWVLKRLKTCLGRF